MIRKGVLLTAVVLLSAAGFVQAQEGGLTGTVDVTYLSRYVWRGYDMYEEDHSAIQFGTNLNLFDTGFGFKVEGTRANGSGDGLVGLPNESLERWQWTLHYANSLRDGESSATNYMIGWTYWNQPDLGQETADFQEMFLSLSWPEFLSCGVVPSYTVVRMWTSSSKSWIDRTLSGWDKAGTTHGGSGSAGGWLHIPGLDYDCTMPGTSEQPLHLSAAATYNDGVLGADHDWSHAVFGASTNFDLGNNLTFTPGVYYQVTFEDWVNDDKDETWVSLGVSYKF
ncbi:MAG: hypothetical protein H8E73_05510 [Planctomycetes bacterium]|nr:hypothetical protein [Planctomycetota bacterium]